VIAKVSRTSEVLFSLLKKEQRIFLHAEDGHFHFRYGLDLPMNGVDKII
jgi:hypothetical protein